MLRTDKVEMSPNDLSPDDKTILVQSITADDLNVVTLPADGTGPFADAADGAETDRRDPLALFTGRKVDRLSVNRVGPRRDFCPGLSTDRRQVADLDRWRHRAGLARRREGNFLREA